MLGRPQVVRALAKNVFIARAGTSRRLGLWGSLVYPSGFGSLRRQFKSAQPHSSNPGGRHGANILESGRGMASEDGGTSLQLDVGTAGKEAPHERRERHDDPHGPRVPVPLGRRRRTEGTRDRGVADLPRLRADRPTGAFPLPCPAVPRGLRATRNRRLSSRLRVRGPCPRVRDCGEARARAACLELARAAGEKIREDDDRARFFKDLRTVPRAKQS